MKYRLSKPIILSPFIFTSILANIEYTCFLANEDRFPDFKPKIESSELPSSISYSPPITGFYSVSATGTSLSNYRPQAKI